METEAEKLAVIQKIVDLAKDKKSDVAIAKQLNISLNTASEIRKFFGIFRHKVGIDIREEWKMAGSTVDFGIAPFVDEFDLSATKKYKFKAVSIDKKLKTITLKISEA